MNREIVYYRVWDEVLGKMLSPEYLIEYDIALRSDGVVVSSSDANEQPHMKPLFCSQKKDRHGKYIYQGSIVAFYEDGDFDKEPGEPSLVIWEGPDCRFAEEGKHGNFPLERNHEWYEVIGSIQEDPHLLEVQGV